MYEIFGKTSGHSFIFASKQFACEAFVEMITKAKVVPLVNFTIPALVTNKGTYIRALQYVCINVISTNDRRVCASS